MTDRYYYFATLVDALALSSNHSSDYIHVCLDYISGSAISGALASRLYREGSIDTAILNRVFQNNEAVFSHGLPLKVKTEKENGKENDNNNETDKNNKELYLTLPAPSCLHYEKGTSEGESPFENPALQDPGPRQLKQVRSGYLDSHAQKFSVTRSTMARTAIDPETQGAKDGQFFTRNFINAGAVFWGYIAIPDNTIPRNVMVEFLSSTVRIGKSRSNEFGRVKFTLMDEASQNSVKSILESPAPRENELYLWCLSDTEFINTETGQSTWTPQFSNLWLPGFSSEDGTFDPEKSFIRTGRIRLFNRKRNGLDSEKMVIKRGSIIRFTLKKPLSSAELQELSLRGIGLSRHQGFGRVMVNPTFLDKKEINPGTDSALFPDLPLKFPNEDSDTASMAASKSDNYSYLTSFVRRRKEAFMSSIDYDSSGREILDGIIDIYIKSRKYNNSFDTDEYGREITDPGKYGPSLSQWSIIRDLVNINKCGEPDSARLDDDSAIFKEIRKKLQRKKERESARTSWDTHFMCNGNTNATFYGEFLRIISGHYLGSLKKALDILKHYDMSRFATLIKEGGEAQARAGGRKN